MNRTFFELKFRTAIMLLVGLAFNVASVNAQVVASGDCGANGNNLTWELTGTSPNYTLTISGSGAMANYPYNAMPWYDYLDTIKTVIIDNGVTTIGDNAFFDCRGLTSVTIPNSVITIGSDAFRACRSLTSVTIPNSVTTIGSSAFGSCERLNSVTIPNIVTTIEEQTFYGCKSLTSVIIPNSVITIGNYAFGNCFSLTSVTIGNSVTKIGNYDFNECGGLTSITIPKSVTEIGNFAFGRCRGLTSITNLNPVPVSINANVFYDVNVNACTLKVVTSALSAYKNAAVWKDFIIEDISANNINNYTYNSTVNVYPNPTRGELRIDNGEMINGDVEILDVVGRVVFRSKQETTMDISHLSSGIYFLKIAGKTVKIIKN